MSGPSAATGAPRTEDLDGATRRLIAVLVCGAVVPLLDTVVAAIMVEELSGALAVPVSQAQWVLTGYALACVVSLPVTGWATRRLGARRLWLAALALCLCGAVGGAAAWDLPSLVAWRVVQGVGGGLSLPVTQTLLLAGTARSQAPRLMAAIAVPAVVVPIAGPAVTGLVLDALGWRWSLLLSAPFCVAALLLGLRLLPRDQRADDPPRLDAPGFLLLSGGLVLTVFGLAQAADGARPPAAAAVPVAAGALLVAAFAVRAVAAGPALVDVRLFASARFSGAWGTLLVTSAVFYAGLIVLPLYLQGDRSYTLPQVGWALAVQGTGALAARWAAGRLTARFGTRAIAIAGLLLGAAGTVPFALDALTGHSWVVVLALLVRGAGFGAVTILAMAACYHGVADDQLPHASTLSRVATQLGAALGPVLAAALAAGAPPHYAPALWACTAVTAAAVLPALLLPRTAPQAG
ncbi:MFS transporter [Allonocardiopsis opalescens]|uniref:EmrB/QacA subfamily drug resistance transporter n=1 Tax=Allonocardiopsis opalescens TaxID=1144618 RepID=A0A2T0Q502_9ACTN|nr:MFS transporter [Allonocardiopsis opalescens]PRX98829.1 EmrB/QacA subfamily drug resistance transporter [Allonocardiopsis opalescens]